MIGYLSGKMLAVEGQTLILDVQGVGYEITLGPNQNASFEAGKSVAFWIFTYVREDQLVLYGFSEKIQKKLFLVLLQVTGVGPKLALAIVSQLSAKELIDAILLGQVKSLCSVTGVGKKLAERLILELKDKLGQLMSGSEPDQGRTGTIEDATIWRDLLDAMSGLGFADSQIRNVLKLARSEFADKPLEINQLLKFCLQKIKNC